MATYYSNDFRAGLKIMLDGEPYAVEASEFVKPGKGQAFARVKLRRLLTGTRVEKTFKSTDSAEGADVVDMNLTYLYNDGEFWLPCLLALWLKFRCSYKSAKSSKWIPALVNTSLA